MASKAIEEKKQEMEATMVNVGSNIQQGLTNLPVAGVINRRTDGSDYQAELTIVTKEDFCKKISWLEGPFCLKYAFLIQWSKLIWQFPGRILSRYRNLQFLSIIPQLQPRWEMMPISLMITLSCSLCRPWRLRKSPAGNKISNYGRWVGCSYWKLYFYCQKLTQKAVRNS